MTIRETRWGRMYRGASIRQVDGRRELYFATRRDAEDCAATLRSDPAMVDALAPDAILDVARDGSSVWVRTPAAVEEG